LPRAARVAAERKPAPKPIDRTELRHAYRPDEEQAASERIEQARLTASHASEATTMARTLVKGMRAHKPSGVDAFLHAYDLGSDEGIAMMCLAEALLRIPDAHTADELIADKLSGPDWSEKLGRSDSAFVNAATFSLLLTGKVLEGAQDRSDNWKAALGRAVGRLGEPVVRTAVREAMKILGRNFVFGRTIDEALKRAEPERRKGLSHSFDMLGEAAKTYEDAERYADAYRGALDRIAKEARGGFRKSPGISVKLTALHPRFEYTHRDEALAQVIPVARALALKAAKADVHFTIDAEEADRLELQMDVFEALLADDEPSGEGRLLGHRDQARAGRRAGRLPSVDSESRDRRLIPRLRQEDAGGERCHLPRLCHSQREHDRPGQGACR
jgi:RHH-type proline utilization regulon transcriptional repressor/proline dehydrogenase/delta 1-pyrroline-5-carboxylate dehydrogenase